MEFIKRFINEEDGADMVEYALLIALVALGAIGTLTAFTGNITTGFTAIGAKVVANVK